MYDDLVKRLRNQCRGYGKECKSCYADGNCRVQMENEAADAIEELQQVAGHYYACMNEWFEAAQEYKAAAPKWIPVTERLPEETWERVLAYTDEGQIMTLPSCKVGNGYVTHWMPLPEPPKEEEDADN